jgi:hypothetical protein
METRMKSMPPGSLFVYESKSGKHYYHKYKTDGAQRTIPLDPSKQADREKIKKLMEKKTLVHARPLLRNNLQAMEKCIIELKPYHPANYPFGQSLNNNYYLEDDVCIKEWMQKEDQQNFIFPEHQIHECKNGKMMRSKSEVLIADMLIDYSIPFKYEPKLVLNGRVFFPDFELLHPITKKLFWWEHLGNLKDPEYVFKNLDRLDIYSKNNIILGENLILTFETSDKPLTRGMIRNRLEYHGFI